MKGNRVIWILVFACLGLVINAGGNVPGFPLMRQSPSAVSLILPQPDSSSVSSPGLRIMKKCFQHSDDENIAEKSWIMPPEVSIAALPREMQRQADPFEPSQSGTVDWCSGATESEFTFPPHARPAKTRLADSN